LPTGFLLIDLFCLAPAGGPGTCRNHLVYFQNFIGKITCSSELFTEVICHPAEEENQLLVRFKKNPVYQVAK
jgi:hypothetical protein